jgi:putative membrane protein
MKEYLVLFLKGAGMGAANVVPGVSGGTIALITGIFQKLIESIKAFNLIALQLLLKGKFKALSKHINFDFLLAVFAGVTVSILSVARLFAYLFENYPIYIWSFFFGLILASIYFVGKTIKKWNISVIFSLIIGTLIAVAISLVKPASENSSLVYLIICGIVGACSMILPGLSGSFVLILMGNYQLVMIESVNSLDLTILLPVVVGRVSV